MNLSEALDLVVRVKILRLYSVKEFCDKVVSENREVFDRLAKS